MSVATTVAPWGNSEAVRIPKSLLRSVGLSAGDKVTIGATERGSIEIVPTRRIHRRVQPKEGVTFATLFDGYEPTTAVDVPSWPSEDMAGAEAEAWRDYDS